MTRTKYLLCALAILLAGLALRTVWMRADPPTTSVGVVWHDEGAWVHNARNMELWGVWRTDNWNPVFIAPVFTGLEYAAFRAFGVGTWQARTVPAASGLVAIFALMAGLRELAKRHGERTALIGGAVLAANFTWVMWNRAALMESTMTMFIVAAWAGYVLASRRPLWGIVAGAAATLAFFTKASAAFFVAAIVIDASWTLVRARLIRANAIATDAAPAQDDVPGAWWTLLGVSVSALAIGVAFVAPHWTDYQFYNWQMSVERKPAYDVRSFLDRATWLPFTQDILTRMWLVIAGASIAILGIAARWRDSRPGERLLVLWTVLGLAELIVHDSSNERRYVMFIPALVALAALVGGQGLTWLPADLSKASRRVRLVSLLLCVPLAYVVIGILLRPLFEGQIEGGIQPYRNAVRTTAALSVLAGAGVFVLWRQMADWLSRRSVSAIAAIVLAGASVGGNLFQFARWARHHSELNYQASVALGDFLPPGTLVHGKLANGLDLENQIKPVFVGRGFGNYDDRLSRDDARYILTISLPTEGRESQPGLMREIIDHYPNRRVVATFDVDDTPGKDQAVLIDKNPATAPAVSGSNRAPD